MNNDYMAIVKAANYSRPVKLTFQARNNRYAIDEMYSRVNATTASDIEEYELYQILEDGKYLSVACKNISDVVYDHSQPNKPISYSEKVYQSYQDVA